MRAGVEIVIGNMCLRQTKQKKVCLMKVVRVCVCASARVFLSLMSQHEVQTLPKKINYRMLRFQQSRKYSCFNWLFVYRLHSAADARVVTSYQKVGSA